MEFSNLANFGELPGVLLQKRLESISFSKYSSLEKCLGRGGNFSIQGSMSLMPELPSKQQIVGLIFHKALEISASHSEFSSAESVEIAVEEVTRNAKILPFLGYLKFVSVWPEIYSIEEYLEHSSISNLVSSSYRRRKVEKKIKTKDGLITGIIDSLIEYETGVIDFWEYKSGDIFQDGGLIEMHVVQLHVYAGLILDYYGALPAKGNLHSLKGEKAVIPIDAKRVEELMDQMRRMLRIFNSRVAENPNWSDLANPSQESCSWCNKKPVCGAFWKKADLVSLPNGDIPLKGEFLELLTSNSDRAVIKISVSGGFGVITVSDFYLSRFPTFAPEKGQPVLITKTIRKDTKNFKMTDLSQIYLEAK